jgi:hypothetical protein
MTWAVFTTIILLLSVIQAHALQRGSGNNSSTTCNTPLTSKLLPGYGSSRFWMNRLSDLASLVKVEGHAQSEQPGVQR